MKPIEQQTVKALSWQMVYGNYRSKLGAEGWEQLEQTVGAPQFKGMDSDEDTPMGPFNEAVLYMDRELGDGDGSMVEEITVASVDRWASIFRNLVKQLQGRPQKMMEIYSQCKESCAWSSDGGSATCQLHLLKFNSDGWSLICFGWTPVAGI